MPGQRAAFALLALTAWQPALTAQVSTGGDRASELLNGWFAAGQCAGLEGVYYENRDGGHSLIGLSKFPQLRPYPHDENAQATPGQTRGTATTVRRGKVVVGNASMAANATHGGSLARQYYTYPQGFAFLQTQYFSNNLFVYPEHRDHDPGANGRGGYGDLFPANTPYLLICQGSSGSDRAFLDVIVKGLAALRPAVREKLEGNGLLMPTLQALFRQSYGPEDWGDVYFTGKAHPVVFDGNLLSPERMVEAAQALTTETLPPVPIMEVLREDAAVNGRDFFEPRGASEKLADSPCAIARIYRTAAPQRKMTVSLQRSIDLNPSDLTARWVVLQGDAGKVRIDPSADGRSAEITVSPPSAPSFRGEVRSHRIDIGVFVKNKHAVSPPGIISFYFPPNVHRVTGPGGRTLELTYGARDGQIRVPAPDIDRYGDLLRHFRGDHDPVLSPLLREAVAPQEDKALSLLSLALERLLEAGDLTGLQARLKALVTPLAQAEKDARASLAAARKEAKENPGEASDAAHQAAGRRLALALEKRDAAAPKKAEMEREIKTLQDEAKALLAAPLENLGRSPRQVLAAAFSQIADGPPLDARFPARVAQGPAGGAGRSTLGDIRRELVSLAILQRTPDGKYTPIPRGDPTPPNDAHHLRLYNLTILGQVLFPGALGPSVGTSNYVDPRISTRKLWRDVYRYAEDGSPAGWIRFQDGGYTEFDAAGSRLTAAGPVPVKYGVDPKSQQFRALP